MFYLCKLKPTRLFKPFLVDSGMKNRIKQLMESQHMTQQVFADFIGISSASLSSIFNERTKATINTVDAIKAKFPNINLEWLMYGKLPMFKEQDEQANAALDFDDGVEQRNLFSSVEDTSLPMTKNEYEYSGGGNHTGGRVQRTEVKFIDKPQRNITEIRIFFDDQTWETFVPKK